MNAGHVEFPDLYVVCYLGDKLGLERVVCFFTKLYLTLEVGLNGEYQDQQLF